MPSTTVTFRISKENLKSLRQVAKIYGSPYTSFVRDAVQAMCSGDMERVGAFLTRLQRSAMKQMEMELGKAQKRQKRRRRATPG
jgi:hypothetical protein